MHKISAALPAAPQTSPGAATDYDAAQVGEALRQLADMLDAYDTAAGAFVNDRGNQWRTLPGVDKLQKAIDEFDFDTAGSLVRTMLADLDDTAPAATAERQG